MEVIPRLPAAVHHSSEMQQLVLQLQAALQILRLPLQLPVLLPLLLPFPQPVLPLLRRWAGLLLGEILPARATFCCVKSLQRCTHVRNRW